MKIFDSTLFAVFMLIVSVLYLIVHIALYILK